MLSIELEDAPEKDDVLAIYKGLDSYNLLHAPDTNFRPLVIVVRDGAGKIVGGLAGETYWG